MCGCPHPTVSLNLLENLFCTVQYRCIFVLIIWTLLCVISSLPRELNNRYLYVPFGRLTQKRESPGQDSRAQLALHYCDKNILFFTLRIIPLLEREGTSANIEFLVICDIWNTYQEMATFVDVCYIDVEMQDYAGLMFEGNEIIQARI